MENQTEVIVGEILVLMALFISLVLYTSKFNKTKHLTTLIKIDYLIITLMLIGFTMVVWVELSSWIKIINR